MKLSAAKIFVVFKTYGWVSAGAAAALLLNLAFFLGVRSGHWEFTQKNRELSLLSAKKAMLIQLGRDETKILPLYERLERSFVSNENIIEFIEYLENAAREYGGSAEVESVSEASIGGRMLKISLVSSYAGLANFTARLENSDYLIKILKIETNKSSDAAGESAALRSVINLMVLSL